MGAMTFDLRSRTEYELTHVIGREADCYLSILEGHNETTLRQATPLAKVFQEEARALILTICGIPNAELRNIEEKLNQLRDAIQRRVMQEKESAEPVGIRA